MKKILKHILFPCTVYAVVWFIWWIMFPLPITDDPTNYTGSMNLLETKVVWVSDPIEVGKKLRRYNEENDKRAIGLAQWDRYDAECTIWAYEPKNRYDSKYMRILGHELLHCFRGRYHD